MAIVVLIVDPRSIDSPKAKARKGRRIYKFFANFVSRHRNLLTACCRNFVHDATYQTMQNMIILTIPHCIWISHWWDLTEPKHSFGLWMETEIKIKKHTLNFTKL